jgi:hypothetical protein
MMDDDTRWWMMDAGCWMMYLDMMIMHVVQVYTQTLIYVYICKCAYIHRRTHVRRATTQKEEEKRKQKKKARKGVGRGRKGQQTGLVTIWIRKFSEGES